MKQHQSSAGFICFLLPLMFLFLAGFTTTFAQEQTSVSTKLEKAIQYYNELDFEKGLSLTKELLQKEGLNDQDSIAIYSVMSMLTYAMGTDYLRQAFQYLDKIAQIGPCKVPLPYHFWPQQLRDQWYDLAHAQNALMCTAETSPEIQTVAIMEFDNYSVGKYQEELGFITKGLADFFESDFAKISSLRVVERDKIDFILKEIEMAKEGKVDASTAVKVGKILGAQLMVFGSIVQIDKNNTKMLCKVVKVETSEILTSVEREGKPDYFAMEKELVMELAEKLNLALNDNTKKLIQESGTASTDAATLYAKGLYYMDQYDYKKAYEFFRMAYDMDNTFTEAKKKMDIYHPLAA
ncbi:MAG: CsgG/HfaB family protein [candidate division Zixibacteria bacterium]|nr:CsgG/HfaB family protein [candidate division Zixibacteria bacterium]MDD5425322.1 CsgG/HfaB family protein [candidate division Zixibacteria bacterium]